MPGRIEPSLAELLIVWPVGRSPVVEPCWISTRRGRAGCGFGIETVSSVTPNDPNSSPMTVGDAPSRRLRSGRTGMAIE